LEVLDITQTLNVPTWRESMVVRGAMFSALKLFQFHQPLKELTFESVIHCFWWITWNKNYILMIL